MLISATGGQFGHHIMGELPGGKLEQLGMGASTGGQFWQLGLEAPLMVNIGKLAQEHALVTKPSGCN